MSKLIRLHLVFLFVFSMLTSQVCADAIVVSQAMFANTIAEYFVEDDHVRIELEISMQDLQSFRNILPESIYSQVGFVHRTYAAEERL